MHIVSATYIALQRKTGILDSFELDKEKNSITQRMIYEILILEDQMISTHHYVSHCNSHIQ
jgi:hypothetical protein